MDEQKIKAAAYDHDVMPFRPTKMKICNEHLASEPQDDLQQSPLLPQEELKQENHSETALPYIERQENSDFQRQSNGARSAHDPDGLPSRPDRQEANQQQFSPVPSCCVRVADIVGMITGGT